MSSVAVDTSRTSKEYESGVEPNPLELWNALEILESHGLTSKGSGGVSNTWYTGGALSAMDVLNSNGMTMKKTYDILIKLNEQKEKLMNIFIRRLMLKIRILNTKKQPIPNKLKWSLQVFIDRTRKNLALLRLWILKMIVMDAENANPENMHDNIDALNEAFYEMCTPVDSYVKINNVIKRFPSMRSDNDVIETKEYLDELDNELDSKLRRKFQLNALLMIDPELSDARHELYVLESEAMDRHVTESGLTEYAQRLLDSYDTRADLDILMERISLLNQEMREKKQKESSD